MSLENADQEHQKDFAYNKAKMLLKTQNLENVQNAMDIFRDLGEWRDSPRMVEMCKEYIPILEERIKKNNKLIEETKTLDPIESAEIQTVSSPVEESNNSQAFSIKSDIPDRKNSNTIPLVVNSSRCGILPREHKVSRLYSEGHINRKSKLIPQTISNQENTEIISVVPKESHNKQIVIGIIVAVAMCICVIVYQQSLKSFKNEFTDNWIGVTDIDGDSCTVGLNIYYDEIDYVMPSFIGDIPITDYEYKVIAPGYIKINGKTYRVKIKDDVMTFKPALTSTDNAQYWYR